MKTTFAIIGLIFTSLAAQGQVLLTDAVIQGSSFSGTVGTSAPPAGIAFVQQAGTNYASTSSATVVVTTTNLPWIPTNSIPPSTATVTNYVLLNLTNVGPVCVATNINAVGSFLLCKPTVTVTAWP